MNKRLEETKLKSVSIKYLTDKFIAERYRADKAEQKMYEGIKECFMKELKNVCGL